MYLSNWLVKLEACPEAIKWAGKRTSLERAWKDCKRWDWLLWLCAKMVRSTSWPSRTKIVSILCDILEIPAINWEGEDINKCLASVRRWVKGPRRKHIERFAHTLNDVGCYKQIYYILCHLEDVLMFNDGGLEKDVGPIVDRLTNVINDVQTLHHRNEIETEILKTVKKRLKPGSWPGDKK